MVSALVSERSGFEPWPGTLCCVLGQDSHSASLHPGVEMVSGELTAGGITLRWTSIPSRGGVEILLVASCYRNRD